MSFATKPHLNQEYRVSSHITLKVLAISKRVAEKLMTQKNKSYLSLLGILFILEKSRSAGNLVGSADIAVRLDLKDTLCRATEFCKFWICGFNIDLYLSSSFLRVWIKLSFSSRSDSSSSISWSLCLNSSIFSANASCNSLSVPITALKSDDGI